MDKLTVLVEHALWLPSNLSEITDIYDLGGFPYLPIMEDFELLLRLKRLGRIVIIPVPVLTSGHC